MKRQDREVVWLLELDLPLAWLSGDWNLALVFHRELDRDCCRLWYQSSDVRVERSVAYGTGHA